MALDLLCTLQDFKGLAAALVCMIIWNLQGFLLQHVFIAWPNTLFVSYTSGWFLSINLIIGIIQSVLIQKKPWSYVTAIICNKRILIAALVASVAFHSANISGNFAFSDASAPVPLTIATFHL
eukprot:35965_1